MTNKAGTPYEIEVEFPFEDSVGYQIRTTNRLMQRYLQQQIEPHGITPGMWYFLRALWHLDGQTQRELSLVVGTMEPTTLSAIKSMERAGLVTRTRNAKDRRKINVFLTERGRDLKSQLLPLAQKVVDESVAGLTRDQRRILLQLLTVVQNNMRDHIEDMPEGSDGEF